MAKKKRRAKRKKKNTLKRRLMKLTAAGILTILVLLALFIFAVYHNIFGRIPDEEKLMSIRHENATLVFSSDNILIGKFFAENRTNVKWEELPEHLIHALVSTEDARYFEHQGIDSRSLMRVLIKTIIFGDKSSGGGSTITQQLAKNLFGRKDYGILTMPVVKVKEAIVAYRLEKIYSKQDILLLYLNTVPFGEDTYGIEAAANRYFNKNTEDLNIQESAVLVGILKANTYYNPRLHPDNARRRRNVVLHLMAEHEYLSPQKTEELKNAPLQLNYSNFRLQGPAPYFLKHVKAEARKILQEHANENGKSYNLEKDGLKITTTLDYHLQKLSREAVRKHLSAMQKRLDHEMRDRKAEFISVFEDDTLKKREVFTWDGIRVKEMSYSDSLWHYKKMLHAGVVLIDPKSGNILAWTGGNNYRYLPYDMVLAKRPAASAFKPVLYATALELEYQPCDYLDNDVPVFEDYPDWKPENYDGKSGGEAAMWYALANSMNLPAIDLYRRTGYRNLDYMCRRLGFSNTLPEGPAAALGTLEVSLLELAVAYSAFANNGKINIRSFIKEIRNAGNEVIYQKNDREPQQVLREESAQTLTAMLLRATSEGTGRALYNKYNVSSEFAGKTGTSQNYSDARYVCYNNELVMAVWVGAADPQVHFSGEYYGSGSSLALPVAGIMLNQAEQKTSTKRYFVPPAIPGDTSGMFDCDPTRDKTFSRNLWQKMADLINGDDEKELSADSTLILNDSTRVLQNEEESGTKVGRLLRRVFGSDSEKE